MDKRVGQKRIILIVQARMFSKRLPKKVMKEVLGKPLLAYQVERLRRVKNVTEVVLAISNHPDDDSLVDFSHTQELKCFRGSAEDVLERYYLAAKKSKADVVVRVCADCPLIDPQIIEDAIELYFNEFPNCDYVSNTRIRTYPRGMDVEVFSFEALSKAHKYAKRPMEREHVTPFLYREGTPFHLGSLEQEENLSDYRLTVDEPADFDLIRRLIEELYPKDPSFSLKKIMGCLKGHPEWKKINSHVLQKEISSNV